MEANHLLETANITPREPSELPLHGSVIPGTSIAITFLIKSDRVTFDLIAYSPTQFANIALRIEPRIDEQFVVRSSKINDYWGAEESDGGMPFTAGQTQFLTITCTEKEFVIYVDGQEFAKYSHRIDPTKIVSLGYSEELELFEQAIERPLPTEEIDLTGQSPDEVPLETPVVPGTSITITGFMKENVSRVAFKLLGYSTVKQQNVVLHFEPRFSENLVVRTVKINDSWGTGETDGGIPFTQGKEYSLKIVCTEENFVFYVDDELFTTFKHRVAPETIVGVGFWEGMELYKLVAEGTSLKKSIDLSDKQIPPEMPLYGTIIPGTAITITGRMKESANRVAFNLLAYSSVKFQNVALQVEARFDQDLVVRRSKINDSYTAGEKDGEMPFAKGKDYVLKLVCEEEKFVIYIDGSRFAEYVHRLPFQTVVGMSFGNATELSKYVVESPLGKQEMDLVDRIIPPELPIRADVIAGQKF